MAMSKEAKVLNLSYLTETGGTQLVKALFLQRFTDIKPHNVDHGIWTVDMFLKTNMDKIRSSLRKKHDKRSMQILYPTEGTNTNLKLWDLSLFVHILKKTCHLSPDMRMKLSALKKLRNKLAHRGDSDISDTKYMSDLDKIRLIFETVLNELKDEELRKYVREMFQKIEVGVIPYTELSNALHELSLSCKDIKKSEEETQNTVRAQHEDTRNTIEKGKTDILKAIKSLQQRIESKDTPEIYSRISTTIPVKLKPLNGTTEVDESLTQALVEMFSEEILPNPERQDQSMPTKTLRDAVHKFFITLREKGYEIVKAESGCILLHAKFSLIKLFSFYTDFISGELDIYLDDLEIAAKRYLSFEEFRLEMILYEDDFCRVLREIEHAEQEGNLSFGQGFSESQHNDADRKKLYVQDGGSASVLLTFKPLSHFNGKEFETVLESESKRLIQKFRLPHQASILKSRLSEQEKTGQDGFHLTSSFKKESRLLTKDSSTMTSFDQSRLTNTYSDLRAENDRLRRDLQNARKTLIKDEIRQKSYWSKAVLGLKTTKVSISGYITKKLQDSMLEWTTEELEHLPHFFGQVHNICYQKGMKEWKIETSCQICPDIFKKVLQMHHNPKSAKLVWNPDNAQPCCRNTPLIKRWSMDDPCNICKRTNCIFHAERKGIDLQERELFNSTPAYGHTDRALDFICMYYWRIGNMFIFHGKEKNSMKNTSTADTDPALVFKMMKNCRLFEKQDALYEEVLDVRNFLMHSVNQMVHQDDFDSCIEVFTDFLTKFEGEWSACSDGKREIEQLLTLPELCIENIMLPKHYEDAYKMQIQALRAEMHVFGRFGIPNDGLRIIMDAITKSRDTEHQVKPTDMVAEVVWGIITVIISTIAYVFGIPYTIVGAVFGIIYAYRKQPTKRF